MVANRTYLVQILPGFARFETKNTDLIHRRTPTVKNLSDSSITVKGCPDPLTGTRTLRCYQVC